MGIAEQKWVHGIDTTQSQSTSRFSQSLDTTTLNFDSLCTSHDGTDAFERNWHHYFKTAECDRQSNDPRHVKYTCGVYFRRPYISNRAWPKPDKTFETDCPENTECQMLLLINPEEGGPLEEVGCVDRRDVVKETVWSDPNASNQGVQGVHCGLSLELPGSHYRAGPDQHKIDLVLTEQVQYPNGSAYPAPLLYIRDMSNPWKFYRAVRRDANVASTLVELGVYRGHFLSRKYEFCMQMLPGHTITAAIFSYSFFQVTLHHGRLPATSHLEADD